MIGLLIEYTLLYSSVLLLVALGGCFAEHSGVINLGLEGMMLTGALGGALVLKYAVSLPPILMLGLVFVTAAVFGMAASLFLAVPAIRFNADQTLVGTGINMLALAGVTVFVQALNMSENLNNTSSIIEFFDGKNALTIQGFSAVEIFSIVLAVILLVIAVVVLYKTRFGLRLIACGEHPQAADSVGINVKKMRYAGVLISGALGGLGGIVYIMAGVSQWKFEVGVAGFGFLGLAVMIFGQWKPHFIGLAALLFGFFRALANVYSGFDFLAALNLPSGVYNMMPYGISLLVLILFSKRSRAPKAAGQIYDKGRR